MNPQFVDSYCSIWLAIISEFSESSEWWPVGIHRLWSSEHRFFAIRPNDICKTAGTSTQTTEFRPACTLIGQFCSNKTRCTNCRFHFANFVPTAALPNAYGKQFGQKRQKMQRTCFSNLAFFFLICGQKLWFLISFKLRLQNSWRRTIVLKPERPDR